MHTDVGTVDCITITEAGINQIEIGQGEVVVCIDERHVLILQVVAEGCAYDAVERAGGAVGEVVVELAVVAEVTVAEGIRIIAA